MKVKFNPKTGEMYDFFNLLFWINENEERKKYFDKFGIELEQEHENFIIEFKEDKTLDTEKIKFYYHKDIPLAYVLIYPNELRDFSKLDECFNFILNLDAKTIKFRLVKNLILATRKSEDEEEIEREAKEIAKNDESILTFIKNMELDSSVKWDLFCFIREPEKYRDEFVEFMKSFIPKFYKLYDNKKEVINKFNSYIEEKLNKEGIDFLNNVTRNAINYDSFNEVHILSSYTDYYSFIYEVIENVCNVRLGVGFEETLVKLAGNKEDKFQRNINIYKNFSDRTRFEILKLLNEDEEYCAKDIAGKLGITGATVSYHMNYLLSSNIIKIDRKNRKHIYTINKDVIKESIEYLINEFNLK